MHKKHKPRSNRIRKYKLRSNYFINKNQQYEFIRKIMTMKTDGPTRNEMSSIDTTRNVVNEDAPRAETKRPVSKLNWIKQLCSGIGKHILIEVIVGIVVAVLLFLGGKLVYHHNIHLTEHDKDIEYIKKNDEKQDGEIEKLKDKSSEMKTDIRLLEQRIEIDKD